MTYQNPSSAAAALLALALAAAGPAISHAIPLAAEPLPARQAPTARPSRTGPRAAPGSPRAAR